MNVGLTNTYVNTLAIDPSAPGTLYAATSGTGVFKTTQRVNRQGTPFQPIQDTSAFATCP